MAAAVPSGKPGNMSEKHTRILEQFKEMVADCVDSEKLQDEYYMTRWLRARDYDPKKSETMVRNNVKWRKDFGADQVMDSYKIPPVISQYHTGGLCGYDKEKQPIWWDAYGRCDIKGILHCVKKMDVQMFKVYLLERGYGELFPRLSDEHDVRVDSINVVYDLTNVGTKHMWKPAADCFLEVVQIFEDHYPETLKRCFIVHAPKLFPIMWKVVKPFLSEVTTKKVCIATDNGLDMLQKYMDIDQIPVEFGGTLTQTENPEDPLQLLNLGGPVPRTEYRKKVAHESESLITAKVSAGKQLAVEKHVRNAGDKIKYMFLTEENDIGFGIFRKTEDPAQPMEEVLASSRRDCYLVPDEGELVCDRPGTYVCVFDNKHSWVKAKQLLYEIDVIAQDDSSDSDDQ